MRRQGLLGGPIPIRIPYTTIAFPGPGWGVSSADRPPEKKCQFFMSTLIFSIDNADEWGIM
jgi:hypothetical protein